MPVGFPVVPMKATLGSLPPADEDHRWAYEIKWDGHRAVAHVHDGTTRVQSPAGHEVTGRWHELTALADSVNARHAILDGEVVVLGADGRPSFDLIQRRHGRGTPSGGAVAEPPVGRLVFQIFDVLSIDGTDTVSLPYLDRRRLLAALAEPGDHWAVPEHRIGDGAELVRATGRLGLEGVIAKRIESTYRVGGRSTDWRKIKHRRTVELPIGGFTAGAGVRAHTFGSLLLGHDRTVGDPAAPLRFAGAVGTGFDDATLRGLTDRLAELVVPTSPFDPPPPRSVARSATWVEPAMTARVEIAEFTNDGRVRHASFVDLV